MQYKRGFTMVELLIVIVVIAILAAISIVAYNGIQTRAKNTKTINATSAWIKAIKLYNAEKGSWPTVNSCFGTSTTYQGSSSGICFSSSPWIYNQAFVDQVSPYMNGQPEPDTADITGGGTNTPRRGAFYQINGNDRNIWMMQVDVTSCPDLGISFSSTGTDAAGRYCVYKLN